MKKPPIAPDPVWSYPIEPIKVDPWCERCEYPTDIRIEHTCGKKEPWQDNLLSLVGYKLSPKDYTLLVRFISNLLMK